MDTSLVRASIGISKLRALPARAFKQAGHHALVVLSHNKPVGYIVSCAWMERALGQLTDHVLTTKAAARLGTLEQARPITRDDL